MKSLIRKILKENLDSNDFNPEDFDWVDTNLEPIKDRGHRVQIIEDTINEVREYKGWRIHKEWFDGVIYWTGMDGYDGMATPEWSGDFEIPVDIMKDDDYDNITVIQTPKFKYVVELQEWYRKNYFEMVYNVLTDYINGEDIPEYINAQ